MAGQSLLCSLLLQCQPVTKYEEWQELPWLLFDCTEPTLPV